MRVGEFRGATGSRPMGWEGCQPGGICLFDHNQFKFSVYKGLGTHHKAFTAYSPFKLQPMGIFLLLSTEH